VLARAQSGTQGTSEAFFAEIVVGTLCERMGIEEGEAVGTGTGTVSVVASALFLQVVFALALEPLGVALGVALAVPLYPEPMVSVSVVS
jgi:hypothetical protein